MSPQTIDRPKKLMVTTREASQIIGLSERTIFNLTKSGQLPAHKIGRSVRYSVAALEKFVEASQR